MLTTLSVRDVVLIRALDLALEPGLTVLTGETGAGKSILLDALGLALGVRAERGLVREGAAQASVTAVFDLPRDHPAHGQLADQALQDAEELILRRVVGADGRSRAFINDVPVALGQLRGLGLLLVEVHGQNEQRGLLNAAAHRDLLDAFGGLEPIAREVGAAWTAWTGAKAALSELAVGSQAREAADLARRERAQDLAKLAPQPGEEATLAARRQRLAQREKQAEALAEATAALAASTPRLASAERRLDRLRDGAGPATLAALDAIGRALVELTEAEAQLEAAGADLDGEPADALVQLDNRLFALRDAARRYRVAADALPELLAADQASLAAAADSGASLMAATAAVAGAAERYHGLAGQLAAGRAVAAVELAAAVLAELPPLRLERARFRVAVMSLDGSEFGPRGTERVEFELAANPGQPFGALGKVASGGELSRLMLALKSVLARVGGAGTLVFDEIDTGVGGATAAAMGARLARLAADRQVLAVTHAPQVAARADHHLTVAKHQDAAGTEVTVSRLSPDERRLELARMLSGAAITPAAEAAAADLLTAG